jgi:predicted DNA-binding transcriptional regulator AlpA
VCVPAAGAMAPPGLGRWSRAQIEHAIGEPLMVPDPMLTAVQAAALLGITVSRIDGLVAAGRLPRHGRQAGPRRLRLSEIERVDAAAPLPSIPRVLRRLGTGTPRSRPANAKDRVSLREAAQIIGLTEQALRRYYFGTPDLPRLLGTHYVIATHDAHLLARRYAARLTVLEAAARLDTTHEHIRLPGHGQDTGSWPIRTGVCAC